MRARRPPEFSILYLAAALLLPLNASAIMMEPTFEAAESMGYQVVREIEFQSETFKVPPAEMAKQVSEIGELCPRTQAYDPKISNFIHFVIIAWSDRDYPAPSRQVHSAHQQLLAQHRAEAIAGLLRREVKGVLSFELVNMANRNPHMVQTADGAKNPKGRYNVKRILENAGAAPSDRLGYGLFAEYSQAAKAVVWVECKESLVRKRGPSPPLVQLVANGANLTKELGQF